MTRSLVAEYEQRYRQTLSPTAERLQSLLVDYCASTPAIPHVDRISVRAKSPTSFAIKAQKLSSDGKPYYVDPLEQIQDQVAARIIVFYKDDVEPTCERIRKYFTFAEQQAKEPGSDWEFGYFGKHFILNLPKDAIPPEVQLESAPALFELQVRTLFEHAWSEASHDQIYKSPAEVSAEETRLCAFASAQAWGADWAFQELLTLRRGRTG